MKMTLFEMVMVLISCFIKCLIYFMKCLLRSMEGKKLKITQHNVEEELKKRMCFSHLDFPWLWAPYAGENPIPDNCIKMHVTKKLDHHKMDEFWKEFERPM
jgi:hypothetical protein